MRKTYDFVVVGAGIVGLTIARSLAARGHKKIALFEKEKRLGLHSSGRNSGVLHAGVYYGTDSLKAKMCALGAKRMREYAAEKNIPLLKTGKVIVALDERARDRLETLYERARANGVIAEIIGAEELRKIEPEAATFEKALYVPETSVIDSSAVLENLSKELRAQGVDFFLEQEVKKIKGNKIKTTRDEFSFGFLVNSAGLHADKVAHAMGVGLRYRILPFKGIYHKLSLQASNRFRGSIYPAPDLRVPFLGVHVTRTVDGQVIVGPTAMPAFGRENYNGFQGLNWLESPRMFWDLSIMMAKNTDGLRTMVREEMSKYRFGGFFKCVKALAPGLRSEDFVSSGKVGLRAQLLDQKERRLVMDFVVEGGARSIHVLNAISPAFTASLAFADYLVEKIEQGGA